MQIATTTVTQTKEKPLTSLERIIKRLEDRKSNGGKT